MVVFLTGAAFLTNIFYLPWLALQRPNPEQPQPPFSRLERFTESHWLPLILLSVGVATLYMGILGTP